MLNKAEFIELIRKNEGLLYKVSALYADSREDRQDLQQEIVYQLWKSIHSFRHESMASTWMYRVAMNTAISFLDKRQRKGSHAPLHDWMLDLPDQSDPIEEERIKTMYAGIKRLSIVEKGIVFLYLEGRTYEEMAGITGFTVTNIGTRLNRIRQQLINHLKK